MQHDPLIIAYLAGVIDSDGFISITRSVHKGGLYHGAIVGIAGTRREPHDLAASVWGGRVGCHVPSNGNKPQFQWLRTGDSTVPILEALWPFLRIKRANAELALELQEHVISGRRPDPFPWFSPDYDPVPHREELRAEMVGVLNIRRRAVQHDGYPA